MITGGTSLLHYRLVEKIGQGGMGTVWKATDVTLGREVAIKVLPEALGSDLERSARFEREAKVLASLNHPNIAAIHGFHEVGPSTGSGPGVGFHSLYAVTPDGQRFLVVTEPEGGASSPITVILDWAVGLKP